MASKTKEATKSSPAKKHNRPIKTQMAKTPAQAHTDARQLQERSIDSYDHELRNDQAIENCSANAAGTPTHIQAAAREDGLDTASSSDSQSDDNHIKNLRWTDTMDYYLGKSFAETVKEGCKIDNYSYDTALSTLNEKLGLKLARDHIRNRLRTWKKQYGTLKHLFSHPGFKWDRTRRMVIADDSVWTNYVKAHPDARNFRGRVIENYDNLCTLFGNDNEVAEAVAICPVQYSGKAKDQAKNMRWTYEMDQCLSKVLAEQVKLGNKCKSGNKLKPVAYKAAVSALNKRFDLDLTIEHIKNRLKTWKKQYEILRGLLHHSEFQWDKTQTMVIADDSAWNQYIKRNPDARSFRGRVIRNYNELFAIFRSDDLPVSSLNSAADDVNLTANNEAVDTELFYDQSDIAKDKGKYILWTDEMDRCLTEQLVEQVTLGNKLQKSFKPKAFIGAVSVLNKKFSLDLTTENIRNRLRTWKKQYRLVKELLSEHGFEWDERQKMVIAKESEWKECIMRNHDVSCIRGRPIDNFNELHIIVGNEQAGGHLSEADDRVENPFQNNEEAGRHSSEAGNRVESSFQNIEEPMEAPPLQVLVDEEMHHAHDNTNDDVQVSSERTRARTSSLSDSEEAAKRRRTNDALLEIMSGMAENIGRIADALTESKAVCLDELFQMVQNIPDFDDDLKIDACEYLSFDEKRARMFMKLDERLRKRWLLKRLRG